MDAKAIATAVAAGAAAAAVTFFLLSPKKPAVDTGKLVRCRPASSVSTARAPARADPLPPPPSPTSQAAAQMASLERGLDARVAAAVAAQAAAQAEAQAAAGTARKTFPPVAQLKDSERKRILVSGGAGFVGSNLVDALMQAGHIVYVMDNLFTGKRKNIEHCTLCRPRALFRRSPRTHPLRSAARSAATNQLGRTAQGSATRTSPSTSTT